MSVFFFSFRSLSYQTLVPLVDFPLWLPHVFFLFFQKFILFYITACNYRVQTDYCYQNQIIIWSVTKKKSLYDQTSELCDDSSNFTIRVVRYSSKRLKWLLTMVRMDFGGCTTGSIIMLKKIKLYWLLVCSNMVKIFKR